MMAWLAGLWSRSQATILAVLAALGAIAGLVYTIRQGGRNAERVDAMKRNIKNVEKANAVEREVRRMPELAVDNELRDKWTR